MDIDQTALEVAAGLCGKMLQAKNLDIKLTSSTERCDVLAVQCHYDWRWRKTGVGTGCFIPRKYGVLQPVGDSVMAGGISRAMRMIPAMIEIVDDIRRYCPDAFFFNYANPMTSICKAVRKASGLAVTGLCHGVMDTIHQLADFAELDREKITFAGVGLNHLTFIYDFRYDGENA